ncbi:MAG: AAA family ATPase [Bacteroidetes bacterium]|nr:AAA family ATPase [Fibrella sp.]
MAKLTVKNVGPIREAELEVKKHTVFIGPQGSGKSTLAKLIAIGGDGEIVRETDFDVNQTLLEKYAIHNYITTDSAFIFSTKDYRIIYENSKFKFAYQEEDENPILSQKTLFEFLNEVRKSLEARISIDIEDKTAFEQLLTKFVVEKKIISTITSYVPAERTLLSFLNDTIWSLIDSNIDFPKSITSFARNYQTARSHIHSLSIPFLHVTYRNREGVDQIVISGEHITDLSQSASGYQSIIPMLVAVEQQRQYKNYHRFIIEEPELNLYPTAQKDLIYALVGGLDPNIKYQDAEWVITTHSPYVLSSLNTLMLAYKVAQRSDELRVKVEKLIPARCWINPDEFEAYYVNEGTVRSIINPDTRLIDENELDDVSDTLADEQEALFDLYRTTRQTRA